MNEPLFLRSEDVEMLHTMAVHRFGGSKGLRDRNAFETAVNPAQLETAYKRACTPIGILFERSY